MKKTSRNKAFSPTRPPPATLRDSDIWMKTVEFTKIKNPEIYLTPREREIMELVIGGKTGWEIGTALGIATDTVNECLQKIYRKLGVNNKIEAVVALLIHEIFLELQP